MRTPDILAVTGTVGTDPERRVGESGIDMTSFRLATNHSRFDKATGQWVEQPANWYTVSAYRGLASHVVASVRKGERVTVVGRLRIARWQSGERSGTSVEIVAETVGLDLTFAPASRLAPSEGPVARAAASSAAPPAPPQTPALATPREGFLPEPEPVF
ncbi:MAG TPA: single-stranded DNA-binding protein [Microbacteriaceae bacterium]|nr:single-stranded DNA-binding protein [Microbacteriaceae bacterium]